MNKEQFQFMEKMIKAADGALKEQQRYIDTMEQKMIDTLKTRREKEKADEKGASHLKIGKYSK